MKLKQRREMVAEISQLQVATIKLLTDKLRRMEYAQLELTKQANNNADLLEKLLEHTEALIADEFDRGQTASAVNGLASRIGRLEKKLLKEPA